jgi:hypothetical protein
LKSYILYVLRFSWPWLLKLGSFGLTPCSLVVDVYQRFGVTSSGLNCVACRISWVIYACCKVRGHSYPCEGERKWKLYMTIRRVNSKMAILWMTTCEYEDMFLWNVGTHTRLQCWQKTPPRHIEFYMIIIYKVYNKPFCVKSDEQCNSNSISGSFKILKCYKV